MVSEDMRERIRPLVPSHVPVHVIHSGKDPDGYPPKVPSTSVRRILAVGRLVEKKGHDDAIKAVGYARARGADVSLRIIGDGPLRQELGALIRREGASGYVSMSGGLPHDQVIHAMREADAVMLACRTGRDGDMEGIPNVLKEAQLMGLPVVATRHSGVPEVVPEGNQRWLANEGDWQRLGELLCELVATAPEDRRLQVVRGRQHVLGEFSVQEEVLRHLRLYDRLVHGRN